MEKEIYLNLQAGIRSSVRSTTRAWDQRAECGGLHAQLQAGIRASVRSTTRARDQRAECGRQPGSGSSFHCTASQRAGKSTDYGTTYEKLNDKVGLKTVLSYLYVNPTNKRKEDGQIYILMLQSCAQGFYPPFRIMTSLEGLTVVSLKITKGEEVKID
ncbi:hypothetical protein CB1_000367001 [Camelus ferus]|nr:hypothetical protein CB1_000367001 [Camelus ferus]